MSNKTKPNPYNDLPRAELIAAMKECLAQDGILAVVVKVTCAKCGKRMAGEPNGIYDELLHDDLNSDGKYCGAVTQVTQGGFAIITTPEFAEAAERVEPSLRKRMSVWLGADPTKPVH